MKKYFEYRGEDTQNLSGKASKFWEVEQVDRHIFVRFGKIGTSGQVTKKDFLTAEDAKENFHKLISEKTKKGYLELSQSLEDDPSTSPEHHENFSFSLVATKLVKGAEVGVSDIARLFIDLNAENFPFHTGIDGLDGSQSLSRRIVFRFAESLYLIFDPEGSSYLNSLDENLLRKNIERLTFGLFEWQITKNQSVFKCDGELSVEQQHTIFNKLFESQNKVEILIPWESALGEFLDSAEDMDLEDFEVTKKDFKSAVKFIESLNEGLELPGVVVGSYKDFLPADCAFWALETLYEKFDSSIWIVLPEECCSGCASTTISSLIETSQGAYNSSSPVFATWGQGSAYDYHADGSVEVSAVVWSEDSNHVVEAAELAKSCGLNVEIGEFLVLS